MKPKSARTLYDEISGKYHENKALSVSYYTEIPKMISLAGDVKSKRVLDAGCGPGKHSKRLISKGASVTGIDVSDEMIRIAREHCGNNGTFLQASFEDAEFEPGSFDLIIASLSLMYSRKPELVFANFHRWLSQRGRVIFSIYHPIRYFQKLADFDFSKSKKVWVHLQGCDVTVFNYYHPLEKYFDAACHNGFSIGKFVEPVLSRRHKGWPEDNYRIPRLIIIEAKKV
jgi:ubiquinone/menaquinone biosynthesis C-methylase UbiE